MERTYAHIQSPEEHQLSHSQQDCNKSVYVLSGGRHIGGEIVVVGVFGQTPGRGRRLM